MSNPNNIKPYNFDNVDQRVAYMRALEDMQGDLHAAKRLCPTEESWEWLDDVEMEIMDERELVAAC